MLLLVDSDYRLTHRCRKCQWPHQSCHSTVHMSACPLDCCLWQCKSYWPHQKGRPSQCPSSENKITHIVAIRSFVRLTLRAEYTINDSLSFHWDHRQINSEACAHYLAEECCWKGNTNIPNIWPHVLKPFWHKSQSILCLTMTFHPGLYLWISTTQQLPDVEIHLCIYQCKKYTVYN